MTGRPPLSDDDTLVDPSPLVVPAGPLRARRRLRVLALAGWPEDAGAPLSSVWAGASEGAADGVVFVDDAFLTALHPKRTDNAVTGLLIDRLAPHYDATGASELEMLLASHPLDETPLLARATAAIDQMRRGRLGGETALDAAMTLPDAPFVLLLDQAQGDPALMGAGAADFQEMLALAAEDIPGARLVVLGHENGHLAPDTLPPQVTYVAPGADVWALMERATAVYTRSAGLGFIAVLAGHKPRVFGTPWYAGWGLTEDRDHLPRRGRRLTRAQAFAAAFVLYPRWYDPAHDALCGIEQVLASLEAEARSFRHDRLGYAAQGVARSDRALVRDIFGGLAPVRFRGEAEGMPELVWADGDGALSGSSHWRLAPSLLPELRLDGRLHAPRAMVADDLGIYYDPRKESRLERMISASVELPQGARDRANRLCMGFRRLRREMGADRCPPLPEGRRVLVIGQIEDSASVRAGTREANTNLALLQATRAANPEAVIVYAPHPEVARGTRAGDVADADLAELADLIVLDVDPILLIEAVDAVWTLTSRLGFEALLRGKTVSCLGTPFYAGWGLTDDRGAVPARRQARPDLTAFVHATLIDYMRYVDPATGAPCPVELALDRMAEGSGLSTSKLARFKTWVQG